MENACKAQDESERLSVIIKESLPKVGFKDFCEADIIACCYAASVLPRAVAVWSSAYDSVWSGMQVPDLDMTSIPPTFLISFVNTGMYLLHAADVILLFLGDKLFNPQVCSLFDWLSTLYVDDIHNFLYIYYLQIEDIKTTMSASLKRGQMLPKEFRNECLHNTVFMAREEVVRMLTTLGSTRNSEIKQLLTRLGLADFNKAIPDDSVMVWYF